MRYDGYQLRYDNRVAVINYADNSVGLEVGRLLVERGASVMFNDSTGLGRQSVEQLRRSGAPVAFGTHDPAQASGAGRTIDDTVERFGRVDIVVNAAGSASTALFTDLNANAITTAWTTRVAAAFALAQAAWPLMSAQGYGRVINVGSYAGLVSGMVTGAVAEDISRGGIVGLTRALAAGSPQAIAVNEVLADGGVAAALIAWLAHELCDTNGRFYAADTTGVVEVFTSAAAGYQCPQPSAFSLEDIEDNWAAIQSPDGGVSPTTSAEYTAFRNAIYDAAVAS